MLFSFLLFAFVFVTNATVPACNSPMVFNPPQNISAFIWYPPSYNGSNLPLFPDNFDCEYQINAPEGWFVNIYLNVNFTNVSGAPVQVIDQLQKTENVSVGYQRFYFVANGGKIKLTTGMSKVQFGFQLSWMQYPLLNPNITRINGSDPQPIILGTNVNEILQVAADTRVSATMLPPSSPSLQQYYRSVIFFDGPNPNSSSNLGTGLQLSDGMTQFVSSTNVMTIMFLLEHVQLYQFGQMILQDYENVKDIVQFQSKQFLFNEHSNFQMNATNGPVAVQTLAYYEDSNPNVIISLNGTGLLDVYQGGITRNKTNLIASYHAENCENYLPQFFLGDLKTYVLNSGVATLKLGNNKYMDFPPTKSFGRKGFFASGNYKFPSRDQDLFVKVDPPIGVNNGVFRYSIEYADLVPGVTLEITNHTNGVETNFKYDNTHLPHLNLIKEISGQHFFVQYKSYGNINRGMYLSFEIIERSSSGFRFSIIISFIVMIIMTKW